MYGRRRRASAPSPPPSSSSLLPVVHPAAAGWPVVHMGGEVKIKMLHHIYRNMRDMVTNCTTSSFFIPFYFFFLACVREGAVNGKGGEGFQCFKTSSQCVSSRPVAFCGLPQNRECKRFPVTAPIMALVSVHGFPQALLA